MGDGCIGERILHIGVSALCTFKQWWRRGRSFPWRSCWCHRQVVRNHPLCHPRSCYLCAGRCTPGCGRPGKGIPFTHHRNGHSHQPPWKQTVSCLVFCLCVSRRYGVTFFFWLLLLKSGLLSLPLVTPTTSLSGCFSSVCSYCWATELHPLLESGASPRKTHISP